MLNRLCQVPIAAVLLLTVSTVCLAQGVAVAAASDLQSVLPGIAAQFEKETCFPHSGGAD